MVAVQGAASGAGAGSPGRGGAALRRGLARTARRLRHGRPALSVIVLAAGGDPGRLRVTLSSVRDQPSPGIEIVVVSSDDAGDEAARAAAGDDTRARFFRAGSVPQARLHGLRRSRGRHVLIAAPGDVYPARALVDLLVGLDDDATLLLAPEIVDGPTLEEAPRLAATPYLGRLLLPRARASTLLTEIADPDPDGFLISLRALQEPFDVAAFTGHRDARSDPRGPFVPRPDPYAGLADRVARDRASTEALAGRDHARAVRARAALTGLRPFLAVAEAATDADWARLVE
ncbi:MAG: hypothetical protein NTV23_00005, partial [Propionibacteriales bacterium]|nr:hypothetical protein [Propionibacteriales bacterium]